MTTLFSILNDVIEADNFGVFSDVFAKCRSHAAWIITFSAAAILSCQGIAAVSARCHLVQGIRLHGGGRHLAPIGAVPLNRRRTGGTSHGCYFVPAAPNGPSSSPLGRQR